MDRYKGIVLGILGAKHRTMKCALLSAPRIRSSQRGEFFLLIVGGGILVLGSGDIERALLVLRDLHGTREGAVDAADASGDAVGAAVAEQTAADAGAVLPVAAVVAVARLRLDAGCRVDAGALSGGPS